jgi:hypothetical protein
VPALPEAPRLLSAADGVPTLWAPDLRSKRQAAQILTSHQDLTITSAAARPHPLQRQGVSRLASRVSPSWFTRGMKTGSRGRRYGFSVRSLECAESGLRAGGNVAERACLVRAAPAASRCPARTASPWRQAYVPSSASE